MFRLLQDSNPRPRTVSPRLDQGASPARLFFTSLLFSGIWYSRSLVFPYLILPGVRLSRTLVFGGGLEHCVQWRRRQMGWKWRWHFELRQKINLLFFLGKWRRELITFSEAKQNEIETFFFSLHNKKYCLPSWNKAVLLLSNNMGMEMKQNFYHRHCFNIASSQIDFFSFFHLRNMFDL